jgi:hypothetical protein
MPPVYWFTVACDPMTSRLIAQMKADSSRAIAMATIGRLPFRVSDRKRPHNLICAFQAISRTALGAAATFIVLAADTWRIPIDSAARRRRSFCTLCTPCTARMTAP